MIRSKQRTHHEVICLVTKPVITCRTLMPKARIRWWELEQVTMVYLIHKALHLIRTATLSVEPT